MAPQNATVAAIAALAIALASCGAQQPWRAEVCVRATSEVAGPVEGAEAGSPPVGVAIRGEAIACQHQSRILRVTATGRQPDRGASARSLEPTSLVGRVFGAERPFFLSGHRTLLTQVQSGSATIEVAVHCRQTPCVPADIAAAELHLASYYWLPDRASSSRASVGFAFDPELGRGGVYVHFAPFLRRVSSGGAAVGLATSYADVGARGRFSIAGAFEYDLSFLFFIPEGGRDRSWNLAIGAELGLSVAAQQTIFGQALHFGFALDPYLELRLIPVPSLLVLLRGAVPLDVASSTTYFIDASVGLGVLW